MRRIRRAATRYAQGNTEVQQVLDDGISMRNPIVIAELDNPVQSGG
jgi:hypothetical protein